MMASVVYPLLHNRLLIAAFFGYFSAQVVKVIIEAFMGRKFSLLRLWSGNGGMPSSHSSTVCAMALTAFLEYGAGSSEAAITFIFAIVVMTDARGVRRETGNQAVVLNQMMEFFRNMSADSPRPQFSQEKLKELIGHTPLQVFVGAVQGIIVALLYYYFF